MATSIFHVTGRVSGMARATGRHGMHHGWGDRARARGRVSELRHRGLAGVEPGPYRGQWLQWGMPLLTRNCWRRGRGSARPAFGCWRWRCWSACPQCHWAGQAAQRRWESGGAAIALLPTTPTLSWRLPARSCSCRSESGRLASPDGASCERVRHPVNRVRAGSLQ